MKKLTAGIFATLLAVVSADSAYAAIASKGYVDDQVGEVQTAVAGKADKATTLAGYGITDAYTAAQGTALAGRVSAVEAPTAEVNAGVTGPVSGGMVYEAIQGVSGNVGTVTSEVATLKTDMTQAKEDISGLKDASATHATQTQLSSGLATKQDKLTQTGSANQPVYVNAEGKVTAGNTIPTVTTNITTGETGAAQAGAVADALADKANTADLGSLATKSSVATVDIASKAVTKEKLADDIVTSLGKADNAVQPSAITDMQVKSNLTDAARWNTDKSSDTKYPSNAAVNAAITSATSGLATDSKMGDLSNLTTTAKTNLVGAINEVDKNADDAKTAADEAQADATKALADAAAAQEAAEAAQTTADAKQDKLSGTIGGSMQPVYLNDGTITAGTALGTLATKSTVTNSEVADGALAQSKISGLATSLAEKLTTPPTSAKGETGLYVLTYDGTKFQWEDIARTGTSE